ncbi:MAG: efflux RND transporter permease subunit, partial [Candidatus Latescibacterota bacterium]
KNKIDEYDTILSDIKSTLVLGIVGVVLILTIYFRQPLAAVFVALPLLMGLIWAFAITYWVIGNLNTMTGFLFVILFGLGIDFGIHLFARYLEDRMDNMDVRLSIETMLSQTGQAILTAALTTSIAFFSLTLTDFKGFSEFGFIVGTGIIMSLITMTTVLPAVLVLADRKFKLVRMRHVWGHDWGNNRGHFKGAKTVLVLASVVTIYLGVNLHKIEFEYDFTNLRSNLPASVAVKQKMATISKYSNESQSYSIVLADSKAELDEIVVALEKKIAEDDPTPTIDKVKTLWLELRGQDEKLEIIEEIRTLANGEATKLLKGEQKAKLDSLRGLLDVSRLAVEDLPENILRKFRTIDGSQAYFAQILPSVQLRDGKNAIAFAEDSQVINTASGKTFYSSSANIIFADMLQLMLRDSPQAIYLTVFVVFLIVLVDFKSLRSALLVMFPLVCGTVWMCGTLYLQSLKLNFYNIVALPTIIGMGIDNGVHLYHRYKEEGPGSMPLVLKSTGGAMLVSMLTTMVGFFGLMTAQHPGLNSIGRLALIGLLTCFITAVFVLPALLEVLDGKRIVDKADKDDAEAQSD